MIFSIIIPTRDRPSLLDRCLQSLGNLSFPKSDFEVIVIDDGSQPPVDTIVERHNEPTSIRLLQQQGQGPAAARNRGLREATGDYVLFTDDDCRLAPDCLNAYLRAFQKAPDAGWGGYVQPAPENPICGDASQLLVTYLYNYLDSRFPLLCSNNVAFPRLLLLELGGFDESFPLAAAEDRDLCDRWAERHPLRHTPEAVVVHYQQLSFQGYLRQHFRYGRGAYHFNKRRKERGGHGLQVAQFSFYYRMLRFPWQLYPFPVSCVHSVLLAISQVANVAGFLHERSR